MIETKPAVFLAGNDYHIMVPVNCETLMWVKVGDKQFYDESNGIMRSDVHIHRAVVPKELLDRERCFTVFIRKVIERKPYFTETEEPISYEFDFKPAEGNKLRAYHISDAHSMVEWPVKAARSFGDIDFLIMNGDVPEDCSKEEHMITVYRIAEKLTGGNIPIVFSRGNHDMRGNKAEKFAEFTPNVSGNTYYTFRTGNIWGLVLDCGEDKMDSSTEYGNTVACHSFRERETDFIKNIAANADKEYNAPGVKHKIVICHNPFTRKLEPPFDIEKDIYCTWAKILRESIKPDMMLCGHTHKLAIDKVGGEHDDYGQPCTVVIGAEPEIYDPAVSDKKSFKGAGFCFSDDGIDVVFTDCSGNVFNL